MTGSFHYDMGEWIDFVRGLSTPARSAEMENHAAQCRECTELLKLFSEVWSAAREMRKSAVPEDWSRAAEEIYLKEMLHPIQQLPARLAALGFDSFSGLAPAGVRSSLQSVRHVTYQSPGLALDLKLVKTGENRSLSIVGQITDRREDRTPLARTTVFVFAGERLVASTAANEFGEFQVTCKSKRRMRISFPFDGFRIDVKLNALENTHE